MCLCCVRLKLILFLCFVLSTWNQNLKRNSVTCLESYLLIFVIMSKDKLNTRPITGKETIWPTRGHWWYYSLILSFISQQFFKYRCSGNGCLRSDIRVVIRVNALSCLVMDSWFIWWGICSMLRLETFCSPLHLYQVWGPLSLLFRGN